MMSLDGARYFDLHMHSTRSDGRYPPMEVLRRCAEGGLHAVSLTDHDLTTPIRPGVHEFEGREILVIAGAELSGTHEGREHHLLVYFPGDIPEEFVAFCQARAQERALRYDRAVESLGLPGLSLAGADAHAGRRSVTRFHLAQDLVRNGHAGSINDAFRRYLSHDLGHVQPVHQTFTEALEVARRCGGVTVWAHPPLWALKSCLSTFIAHGLQGLECDRPRISSTNRSKIKKAAKRNGLFLTGGSDWHGWAPGDLGLFRVDRYDLQGFLSALNPSQALAS